MYSKNEAALLKKEFWTAFGIYLKPLANAEGVTINWVNYKTGVKHIYFRTDVSQKEASVAIELVHSHKDERLEVYEKLVALKAVFKDSVPGKWFWQKEVYDELGAPISRVIIIRENVNIFNKEDWPQIISFLKKHLLGLDAFWALVKEGFEQ